VSSTEDDRLTYARPHSPAQKQAQDPPERLVFFGTFRGHGPKESIMVAVYVLALIVVFLVAYLFYAVINPERF
jgi:K+-transporting ATPase KdpF subunit